MKHFHRIDTFCGWLTFAIAATVYGLTVEPTASFWDCPEFILAGYKLEVGHSPGAPFFMLAANLFTQLGGSAERAAPAVNLLNALLSALTILFLFWTISHLTRHLLIQPDLPASTSIGHDAASRRKPLPSPSQTLIIEAAAFVGAMIYTFSDTFWFSAVEGEVYAFSSAFTAAVFWLILKWEEHADDPRSDRWIILIAYLIGLSIGVHLLGLLCLPAIVLVFVHRRHPALSIFGMLMALLGSFVLIAVILFGIIPGVTTIGGWFELLFVNQLGFRFNSGLLAYLIILCTLMLVAIVYTQRRQLRIANTAVLCLTMLLLGYGSYAVTFVRASANTPMNQNAPKDIFALGRYLARDQYEHGPLLRGQAFASQPRLRIEGNYCIPVSHEGKAIYQQKPKENNNEPDQYIVTGHYRENDYAQQMWFPRMWNPRYADAYAAWTNGIHGKETWYDRCGEMVCVKMPSQVDNMRFFLAYQCGFMYWRYFLWNFAGRQNDIQSHGEPEHGNWLSGFPLIDNWRLGDQQLLPDTLKQNRGHNVYYCLPLLLGLLGILWQCRNRCGQQQFGVVFMLFLMTGLAIVVYLNQTPGQPRERDYAYAGSFYAFAIWCGMGLPAVAHAFTRLSRFIAPLSHVFSRAFPTLLSSKGFSVGSGFATALPAALLCLFVPLQMALQNWDDHDRSGRYICRDAGHNYLASLPEEGNPIILTNGDNDTFPLWYMQEVEGERRDARVCNLQYLQTDWYIDQMRRPAYDSPGLPIPWDRADYITGQNDIYDLSDLPSDSLLLDDHWRIPLNGRRTLYKNELALIELLRHSDQRPLYVAISVSEDDYLKLQDYTIIEGLAARFSPNPPSPNTQHPSPTTTTQHPTPTTLMDTQRTYHNVMTRFRFTNLDNPRVYLDETARGMAYRYRRLVAQLALRLIAEQRTDQARRVLNRIDAAIPLSCLPADFIMGSDYDIARAYYLLGDEQKALERIDAMRRTSAAMLTYYDSVPSWRAAECETAYQRHQYILHQLGN